MYIIVWAPIKSARHHEVCDWCLGSGTQKMHFPLSRWFQPMRHTMTHFLIGWWLHVLPTVHLYLTWGVGGLKMFQGRSYLLPTLVLQPGNQCFTKLPDACLPVTFTKQKIRVLFCHSPYEIIRSHLFLFAKSSCCLRKSACLPPKGLYFHVLISMFLNCKGDGSPHEVMVDHTHFCG